MMCEREKQSSSSIAATSGACIKVSIGSSLRATQALDLKIGSKSRNIYNKHKRIPCIHSICDVLDQIADDFVLYVVQHPHT